MLIGNALLSNEHFVRKEHKDLQVLLSGVHKNLSASKKSIKEDREFSQLQDDDSQNGDGLLKQAKLLISQQKLLLKLFKIHKEMGVKIKNDFENMHIATAMETVLMVRKQDEVIQRNMKVCDGNRSSFKRDIISQPRVTLCGIQSPKETRTIVFRVL